MHINVSRVSVFCFCSVKFAVVVSDISLKASRFLNRLLLSRGVSALSAWAGLLDLRFRTISFHQRDVKTGSGPTQPPIELISPTILYANSKLPYYMNIHLRH